MTRTQPPDHAAREDRTHESIVPDLRVKLLNAQFDLRQTPGAAIILLGGESRQACEATVDRLHEWLDARFLATEFFGEPTREQRERPRFRRYWMATPPRGRISLFFGAWPLAALAQRMAGQLDEPAFHQRLERIRRLEDMLVADGTRLIKIWIRGGPTTQGRSPRVENIGQVSDWPDAWRGDDARNLVDRLLTQTSTAAAPWHIIEIPGATERDVVIGQTIVHALERRSLALRTAHLESEPNDTSPRLAALDLSDSLQRDVYERKLEKQQKRITRLSLRARRNRQATVIVLEGWDAAGKGGAIRRLARAVSLRDLAIVPISAPSEEERAHHYLWRFWRHIPRDGHMVVFDRSWYGRVLVERVEGYATEAEWRRAYDEINDFEAQLIEHGVVLVKLFLHIDQDEQLRRFKARERTPYKKYKLSREDYRNRDRWDEYVAAAEDMFARTAPPDRPWHVIPANDKLFARVHVLRTIARAMQGRVPRGADAD